jgi:hypothetical protein
VNYSLPVTGRKATTARTGLSAAGRAVAGWPPSRAGGKEEKGSGVFSYNRDRKRLPSPFLLGDADERLDEANREKFGALVAGLGDENAAYVMKQQSGEGVLAEPDA